MKLIYITAIIVLMFSCKGKNDSGNVSNPAQAGLLFEILPNKETGIDFENKFTETPELNGFNYINFNNGAGVAVADFNNDGLQDIYFMSTLGKNKLYLNKGNLHFQDISEESGTADIPGFHTGVTTVDINNDGLMDIYICNSGPYKDPEMRRNKLLVNQGLDKNGIPTFKEESAKYGLDIDMCSTQAVFFDFDHDGDLDLFLINHSPDPEVYKPENIEKFLNVESKITGDRLYDNRNGKFVDISKKAGLVNNSLIMGLGVGVSDLNNDGWPDVYVCTDFMGKDALYLNNKNGTFTESSDKSLYHMSYASMGNDLADFNNDGWSDIVTCDMIAEDNYTNKSSFESMNSMVYQHLVDLGLHHQSRYNTLQLNNGNIGKEQVPVFSDIAQMAGVSSTDWSWSPLLFDMDNDGKKDLFVSNGYKADYLNIDFKEYFSRKVNHMFETGELSRSNYYYSPLTYNVLKDMPQRKKNNYFFRNNGDLTFKKMNGLWSQDSLTCSNGAAYADFDNDGDIDIVVNNSAGLSFIYKNTCREKGLGNYLQFNLKGSAQNTMGIGAKIILKQTNGQTQVLEEYVTRGFQSSVSPVLHFGLGADKIVPEIDVIWPDGKEQILTNVTTNQRITLNYKDADRMHNFAYTKPMLFTDATKSLNLNHKHEENVISDAERESLMPHAVSESVLPHKMSDLGPAMAVGDVNKDGLEDFYIGGSKGHPGKLYLQTSDGFKASDSQPWTEDINCQDIKATFFDADGDGNPDLYVVSGGNEYEEGSIYLQDRLYLNDGSGNFKKAKNALPDMTGSGSCVVAFDYDGDGKMDLFVGGRQKPGKYPFPVSSHILRNDSKPGKVLFTDVTAQVAPQLNNIGMVTDAVFADIDGDGKAELIIVGEWMSPKVFKNVGGTFKDITEKTGLGQETGWWNCIVAGDFNHDGHIDLVAGNLGLNYKYKASKKYPFEIYAKDFDNNGSLDLALGYYYNDSLFPVYGREHTANQTPFIIQKFPTNNAFAKATLTDIYGADNLKSALNYKATNFATCYFENNGDGTFKVHPLASLAQISSVNSIVKEDIDGDGNLDLVIAGNMYGSDPETTRNDASIGLYLKGDGKGNFVPVPAANSGLFIDGDVRQINLIHLGKTKNRGIIVAKNNDYMQVIKIK
jgi:hypothetical protein